VDQRTDLDQRPDARPGRDVDRRQYRDYRRERDFRLAQRTAGPQQPGEDGWHRPGPADAGPVARPDQRAAAFAPPAGPGESGLGGPGPGGPGTSGGSAPAAHAPAGYAPAQSGVAGYGPGDPGPANGSESGSPLVAARDEDAEVTSPLPVILPGAAALPRPAPVEAPRGFFEAARPVAAPPEPRPASVTGAVPPPPPETVGSGPGPARSVAQPAAPADRVGSPPGVVANGAYNADPDPDPAASERPISAAATAKLEQLKDLYLTAEAIGEEALDKHFDQVSERQRQLIREFFDRSGPGAGSVS
jgi:hypothetical protein